MNTNRSWARCLRRLQQGHHARHVDVHENLGGVAGDVGLIQLVGMDHRLDPMISESRLHRGAISDRSADKGVRPRATSKPTTIWPRARSIGANKRPIRPDDPVRGGRMRRPEVSPPQPPCSFRMNFAVCPPPCS